MGHYTISSFATREKIQYPPKYQEQPISVPGCLCVPASQGGQS